MSILLASVLLGACGSRQPSTGCAECHARLEPVSAAHTDCLSCHGGDGRAREKDLAHRGMHGRKNPSDPSVWEKTCGSCHPLHVQRVRSALMTTNGGIIRAIQATWEGEDGRRYAAAATEAFDAQGAPVSLAGVAELPGVSGELYRKFCSLCHVGLASGEVYAGSHAAGCAACHFPYGDGATYEGDDPTVRDRWPLSATHAMARLPDNRTCLRCHNRSGRIALSYQGRHDGNNGLVPTRGGEPGPEIISGARNVTSIAPDIHFERGMDCIDCHTSRDVMGDGHAYESLYRQVEVACEDCHGSATERPRTSAITRENDEALRESASYPAPARSGMEMVLTSKGRKYGNAYVEGGRVVVQGKRSGKRHEAKVITGTPEHAVAGHERLECHACHSRTVVQCYGCHTTYDRTKVSRDFIRGADTPGEFSETEDYRTLYPFPLALNQRGRISAVTPGCQTFVTEIGARGERVREEQVARFKGKSQLRFAPFFSHNTGPKAIGCSECHANPAFLGFGQHVVEGDGIEATLLCERSAEKPLDGFLTLRHGEVRAFSAITREGSRPLDAGEVRRVWAVNQCLACHDDGRDPIYRTRLDYGRLERCLNEGARFSNTPLTPSVASRSEAESRGQRSAPTRASTPPVPADPCAACHLVSVQGAHATLACGACHTASGDFRRVSAAPGATGCTACHPGAAAVFRGPMATRKAERDFATAAFGRRDPHFFEKSCAGCHVTDCLDCHGPDGHRIAKPASDRCHSCHRGYFVGADYLGRAPREDSLRYQRGPAIDGERYLKMRPDVHAEAGIACGACHGMASLAAGRRSGKTCTDCHEPSPEVLEHRTGSHRAALECWACHSAWAAQEYGTFFVRAGESPASEHFLVKRQPGSEYVRSAYLRRQDAPPLGRNRTGKVSPIRPQLIAYTSDIRRPGGEENVLLAAQWKAFFPHTIRRGTVVCEGCHATPRRFLVEPEAARIHRPAEDGLTLPSFWSQEGQTLANGRFLSPGEVTRLGAKSPAYRRGTIEKWKRLVQSVEGSSGR